MIEKKDMDTIFKEIEERFPCINCITFAMCRNRLVTYFKKELVFTDLAIYHNSKIVLSSCYIFKIYSEDYDYNIITPNTYLFRGHIGKIINKKFNLTTDLIKIHLTDKNNG